MFEGRPIVAIGLVAAYAALSGIEKLNRDHGRSIVRTRAIREMSVVLIVLIVLMEFVGQFRLYSGSGRWFLRARVDGTGFGTAFEGP